MDIDSFIGINTPTSKLQKIKVKLVVEYNGILYEKQVEALNNDLKPIVMKFSSELKKFDNDSKSGSALAASSTNNSTGGGTPTSLSKGGSKLNLTPTPFTKANHQIPSKTSPSNSNSNISSPLTSTGSNSNISPLTMLSALQHNTSLPNLHAIHHSSKNSNGGGSTNNLASLVKSEQYQTLKKDKEKEKDKDREKDKDKDKDKDLDDNLTIYGKSIETLMNRELNKSKVPRFVKNIINYLFLHCLGVEGIFRISGSQVDIQSRKLAINRGEIEFTSSENPHIISVLFKQFLREMPEPICTGDLYDNFLASSDLLNSPETRDSGFTMLKNTINQLPINNRVLFQYIIHFLTFIKDNSHVNLMNASNLSRVFGPNLFWKRVTLDIHQLQATSEKINSLTEVLINNYDKVFEEPLKIGKKVTHLAKILGHKKSIQWMNLCSSGEKVWSLDSLGNAKIWDSQTRELVSDISILAEETPGVVYQMLAASNDCIWSATSASASVWDSTTGQLIVEMPGESYSLCESQNREVWVGGAQVINIYQIDELPVSASEKVVDLRASVIKPMSTDIFMKGVYILVMCKVGTNRMWGCSSEKTIFVWDSKTKEMVHQMEINEKRPKRMSCIEVDADLETIWLGGDEGNINIFHSSTYKLIHKIPNAGWDKIFNISSINKEVWCSFWDTQIRIFDPKSKEITYTLKGYHSDAVSSILEIPNLKGGDPYIWCGSYDKSITIYTLHSNKWILSNVKKNMARPIIRQGGFSSRNTKE